MPAARSGTTSDRHGTASDSAGELLRDAAVLLRRVAAWLDEVRSEVARPRDRAAQTGAGRRGPAVSDRSVEVDESSENYITLQECAVRLGYSTRWVRDRVRLDGMPCHQRVRGAQYRFVWADVADWVADRYPAA
jgi:predicted DNA-binding transcriptional regulator AlpA